MSGCADFVPLGLYLGPPFRRNGPRNSLGFHMTILRFSTPHEAFKNIFIVEAPSSEISEP